MSLEKDQTAALQAWAAACAGRPIPKSAAEAVAQLRERISPIRGLVESLAEDARAAWTAAGPDDGEAEEALDLLWQVLDALADQLAELEPD